MSLKKLFALNVMAAALVGCGGGDVNIAPQSSTTIGDTTTVIEGTPASNNFECAAYTSAGTTFQGSFDGTNCTYTRSFVDISNPLTVDVTLPAIGDGVHIFEGSVVVGETWDTDAELTTAGISQGGDGPTLTIAAGNTLAFRSGDDFMVVNRGSQLRANGTAAAPITFTSQTDAVLGTVGAEDVSEWGGIIINGFGVTNKCAYTGTYTDGAAPNGLALTAAGCHVTAEGKASAGESHYGGVNNSDNSGVLRYVIVKHTGFEVAPGNELNGIAFNAVGSDTIVENLQAYSTYDDGIEFFGGAVNVTNYVALYVRDDSIDIDEGYRGTITNALVIQAETDGNRCVESDGIGSYSSRTAAEITDVITRGLHSQATIKNLTCIVSATDKPPGTHDPGQGLRIREGHMPTIQNAIVTTAYSADGLLGDDDHNFCVRIDDESEGLALSDDLTIEGSIIACQDLIDGDLEGSSTVTWLNDNGNATYQSAEAGENPTTTAAPELVILDGFYSVPVADMVITGATVPTPVSSSIIGGVSAANDWTAGWTFGLHAGNRAQPLWFE